MRWIYILQLDNDRFYVGETTRLYTRLNAHIKGRGGYNTSTNEVDKILAIYSIDRIGRFFDYCQKVRDSDYNTGHNIFFNRGGILETFNDPDNGAYDNLTVENYIAERMIFELEDEQWDKIRGGKYVRDDVEYQFPTNRALKDLPICKCGIPCDVKKDDKNCLYFRCAKKNIYPKFRDDFNLDPEPCNYYHQLRGDTTYKREYAKRQTLIKQLIKTSHWLANITTFNPKCIGGCDRGYNSDYTVRHNKRPINLCFDCFLSKHDELKKKYDTEVTRFKAIGGFIE